MAIRARLRWIVAALVLAACVWAAVAVYTNYLTVTFVVLGDNRPLRVEDPQPKVFARLLRQVAGEHPAFVVSTGDIVTGSMYDPAGVTAQYRQLSTMIRRLGVPFYVARGNHDAVNPEMFNDFTRRPLYYSMDWGPAVFWFLDTEDPAHRGYLDPKQTAWLGNDLNRYGSLRWKFVVLHRPLIDPKRASLLPPGHQEFTNPSQDRRLKRLFAREGVDFVLEGHIHMYSHTKYGPINYILTGGSGAPLYATQAEGGYYHYIVIKVSPFSVTAEVVRLSGRRQKISL